MGDIVGDLVCVLEHARVSSAICMGHDWGSQVCYEAARMRPDIVTAVVGVAIPYIPSAGPFVPTKHLVAVLPKLAYQVYFDTKLDEAIEELNKDIRRTMRATLRTVASPPPDEYLKSVNSFLDAWKDVDVLPPIDFFTPDEENYIVEQYAIQGFKNTLQFYTTENRHLGWELAQKQGNYTIPQPVLAVLPDQDPVADWILTARLLKSADWLPHLTTEVLPGAHWVHIENHKAFNVIVRKWLNGLNEKKAATQSHMVDEL